MKDEPGELRVKLRFKGGKANEGEREVKVVASMTKKVGKMMRSSGRQAAHARKSGRTMPGGLGAARGNAKPALQRCSTRLTYASSGYAGQWGAHGKYLARESANQEHAPGQGFSADGEDKPLAETLNAWQKAGDPRMFKLILSPEFGDKMNMREFAENYMKKVEADLGVPLQWVAVAHFNTDHPHIHVALRGVDANGHELRINPEYIKTTFRQRAQETCTEQLGVRTDEQVQEALDRQIPQQRFTDLDRAILRQAKDGEVRYPPMPKNERAQEMRIKQIRRLTRLESMGLATRTGPMAWRLNPQLESALRNMQVSNDRLKTMFQNRQMLSDPRLQMQATDITKTAVAGRLIATGLDENKNKPYMLIEGIDGKVHYLYQTARIEKARSEGLLVGHFVSLRPETFTGSDGKERAGLHFTQHGSADALLNDKKHLVQQVMSNVKQHGVLPKEAGYGGWLGQYQKALSATASTLLKQGAIVSTENGFRVAPRKGVSR